MRDVTVICRYAAEDPVALVTDVSVELALRVPDQYSDDVVAQAAMDSARKRVDAMAAEFGITFRPLDKSEGVFVEVQNV